MKNISLTECPKCHSHGILIPHKECIGVLDGLLIGYNLIPKHKKIKAECVYTKCKQPLWIYSTGRITRRHKP